MANPNVQTAQVVNPFPPPPEFARVFTPENIAKNEVPKPPARPHKFMVFGEEVDLDGKLMPSLPELGIHQFYSSSLNWKAELKKLNRSAVAAFLDLLEILIK